MRITVIDGHPDPSPSRLNHALAQRYVEVARDLGSEVRYIAVSRIEFPLLRDPAEFMNAPAPETIQWAQHDIAWADHVVLFFPLWIADVPAILKGFIEQTFRPGFAIAYNANGRGVKKLLGGKSARLVVTMGMPALIYRWRFGEHALKSYKQLLHMCGFSPVEETLIGGVADASEYTRRAWFDQMASIVERDSGIATTRNLDALRGVATAGLLMGGVYLTYVTATWLHYGYVKRIRAHDSLLDAVMPRYEVGVRHSAEVNAPASVTFAAIRNTDFERSPMVRAFFRAREMVLRAKHDDRRLPRGLMEQMAALGWSMLAEEDGREVVLGTVTQPWQPNPVFRSLKAQEFVRFDEPGFAKLALTLRVDPISAQRCEVSTETRVLTTDSASRALFRSYWAFLSPGVDLLRRFLLQQVKAEAESESRSDVEPQLDRGVL
jgi:putative NADPH-quinone reductase